MWILLPNGELKNLDTIIAIVPHDTHVAIEHELPDQFGGRLSTCAIQTESLAESRQVIESLAAQIQARQRVLSVEGVGHACA